MAQAQQDYGVAVQPAPGQEATVKCEPNIPSTWPGCYSAWWRSEATPLWQKACAAVVVACLAAVAGYVAFYTYAKGQEHLGCGCPEGYAWEWCPQTKGNCQSGCDCKGDIDSCEYQCNDGKCFRARTGEKEGRGRRLELERTQFQVVRQV